MELAGEVVEELAKVGQADAAKAQHLCSQFLQTVKVRLPWWTTAVNKRTVFTKQKPTSAYCFCIPVL